MRAGTNQGDGDVNQYRRAVERVLELAWPELGGIVPVAGDMLRYNGADFRVFGVRRIEIGYHLQLVRNRG